MGQPVVSVGIVTWNSAEVITRCLGALAGTRDCRLEVLVLDNASADTTWTMVQASSVPTWRERADRNTGFSAGHNRLIARSRAPYYLALNPDVEVAPDFVSRLVGAMERDPGLGSATGRLLLEYPAGSIDSTGIYLLPSQRHLDRGQGEPDLGQYERAELVFGASGAAALYRRAMLDEAAVEGEVFDESFFTYREDADLAWRAQLLGWPCLYVPEAVATHRRRVTPERRQTLPPALNRMSVRNRFLLRIKNQPARQAFRFLAPALARDLQVVGYCLLREWTSLPALVEVLRLIPSTWRKRRVILARRKAPIEDLDRWFNERSRPYQSR